MPIPPSVDKPYCEWEANVLTPEQWQQIPPQRVLIDQLVPAQPCLLIDRFAAIATGGPREGDDPCYHAVCHRGVTYLHNGHHGWALELARGAGEVQVRVKRIDRACGAGDCCGRTLEQDRNQDQP